MATMREIAEAIRDDMRTRGAQLPEIDKMYSELRLITEVRISYFEPSLYYKGRRKAKASA